MSTQPPLIALVGRPNVGKSTLFNRMVGRRTALVMDLPGVTRDRIFGETEREGRVFRVVDTGGLEMNSGDVFLENMRQQTQLAIEEADLIALVFDGAAGVQPSDHEVVQWVRRSGKAVMGIVNKLDLVQHDERIHEFYELGLECVVGVSGEHGRGFGDVIDAILERVDAPLEEECDGAMAPLEVDETREMPEGANSRVEWAGEPIRVAVIGRPNAGKSSLINQLLGEERLLTTAMAGTTRDSVDATLEVDGQEFVFVDTAGIRRKRSIGDQLERFSVVAAVRSMEKADVALMVLDANEPPSDQDAKIVALAHERGKGILLVANKWDLIDGQEPGDKYMESLDKRITFLDYAPVLRVSAKTGRSVRKIFQRVIDIQKERHRRVGTSELNRYFKDVIESLEPASRGGKRPRIYYVSQPMVRPPTFVFMSKYPEVIRDSYKRYLSNALRDRYGFEGTPIWLKFRTHSKSRPGYGGLNKAREKEK